MSCPRCMEASGLCRDCEDGMTDKPDTPAREIKWTPETLEKSPSIFGTPSKDRTEKKVVHATHADHIGIHAVGDSFAVKCPACNEECLALKPSTSGEQEYQHQHSFRVDTSALFAKIDELTKERDRYKAALEKATRHLELGILRKLEYVKQVDGSVKQEFIDTYQGELAKECREALKEQAGK